MTSSSSSSSSDEDEDETLAEIASRSKHDVGSSSDQNHCTSQDEAKEAKIAIARSKIRDKNITASEGKSDKPLLSNGKDSASYEHINDDNSITNRKSSVVVDSSDSTSKKCKRNYASDTIATASISSVTMTPTATNKKSNAKSQKRDRSQKLSITRPNSGSATQKFTPQQSPRSPRTITFQNQNNQQCSHTLNSQPTSRPGSGKSIDTHPYSRGSVIEVLYIKRKKCLMNNHELRIRNMGCGVAGNDVYHDEYPGGYLSGVLGEKEHRLQKKLMMNLKYWEEDEESFEDWFESSDDSSDEGKRGVKGDVRLCDIIDRAPDNSQTGNDAGAPVVQKWKYYVHYRDFNRRMDEWITVDRIVSPPSVGNAKVRALKRKRDEEEKGAFRRREWERLQMEEMERKRHLALLAGGEDNVAYNLGGVGADTAGASIGGGLKIDVNAATASAGTRKRLRRSASTSGVPPTSFSSNDDVDGATLASGIGTPTNVADIEPTRLTRRQRRRTTDTADIASNAASVGDATGGVGGSGHGASTSVIAEEHTAVDVVTTIAAQELDEHEGMDEAALKEHEEVTKVKNVATIELGPYQMDTWYFSPLPKELFKDVGMIDTLYVDEFSLNFFTRKSELLRYQAKELPKNRRHPPGNEIYRNGNLSMFEVDGYEERVYCQNLCYIAKLFLDHKTLYFDVDPFLFYVLCEVDERGFHPVGYYSKEKYSDVGYNLACILTFPSHQRKGYGRFLIAFSYELSKKEEKVGSPEKPMSDLGQQAYKPYWTSTIVDFLLNQSGDSKSMSIMDISKATSIMSDDIIFTLNQLGILKFVNGAYFVSAEHSLLEELAKKHPIKEPRVDPSKLHWTPYITDVKRDKFSIHSKKASLDEDSASS